MATDENLLGKYTESRAEGGSLIWQKKRVLSILGRGPGRGPALEKPKNPKETIGRLAKYLMAYKGQMLLVV